MNKHIVRLLLVLVAVMLSGISIAQAGDSGLWDIIDNEDLGVGATAFGPWSTSSAAGFCEKNSVFSNDIKKPATFRFESDVVAANPGTYEIYVKWTYHPNRSDKVPHTVDSDDTLPVFLVDQNTNGNFRPDCEYTGNTWRQLEGPGGFGEFNCATNSCAVTVSAANGQASADAVKWVLVEAAPPPPPPKGAKCPCDAAFAAAAGVAATSVVGTQCQIYTADTLAVLTIQSELPRLVGMNVIPGTCGALITPANEQSAGVLTEVEGLTPAEEAACRITIELLAPLVGCEGHTGN